MPSAMAEKTRAKYRGATADLYEAKRAGQEKWRAEDRIVREMLDPLPETTQILDIPIGTGRFIPYYEARGFQVIGLDVSSDMLAQARRRIMSSRVSVGPGDIFAIDLPDEAVDVAVCIRIFNLIDASDMKAALHEVQRVTRDQIILNLRVWHRDTKYRRPQKRAALRAALLPGWHIAEDREIHQHDFRMFRLERETAAAMAA